MQVAVANPFFSANRGERGRLAMRKPKIARQPSRLSARLHYLSVSVLRTGSRIDMTGISTY